MLLPPQPAFASHLLLPPPAAPNPPPPATPPHVAAPQSSRLRQLPRSRLCPPPPPRSVPCSLTEALATTEALANQVHTAADNQLSPRLRPQLPLYRAFSCGREHEWAGVGSVPGCRWGVSQSAPAPARLLASPAPPNLLAWLQTRPHRPESTSVEDFLWGGRGDGPAALHPCLQGRLRPSSRGQWPERQLTLRMPINWGGSPAVAARVSISGGQLTLYTRLRMFPSLYFDCKRTGGVRAGGACWAEGGRVSKARVSKARGLVAGTRGGISLGDLVTAVALAVQNSRLLNWIKDRAGVTEGRRIRGSGWTTTCCTSVYVVWQYQKAPCSPPMGSLRTNTPRLKRPLRRLPAHEHNRRESNQTQVAA
jgi:hypothetical protein